LGRQAAAGASPELAAELALEWRLGILGKEGQKSETPGPSTKVKSERPNLLEE
jgi:hypothetical protein